MYKKIIAFKLTICSLNKILYLNALPNYLLSSVDIKSEKQNHLAQNIKSWKCNVIFHRFLCVLSSSQQQELLKKKAFR